MKVYSYKMNTKEWQLCPQDFYKYKTIILKDNNTIKFEKDVKSLWEYFHKRLKETHKQYLCEIFYIDNIETPIIYGSKLTSEQLNKYYQEYLQKQNKNNDIIIKEEVSEEVKNRRIDLLKRFLLKDELKKEALKFTANKKERKSIVDEIDKYNKNSPKKMLCLYGLRRTGKTVAMFHSILHLLNENKKVAYIDLLKSDNIDDLYFVMDELSKKGIEYFYLDEITYVNKFLQRGSILQSIFRRGNHVILAGTDSYILNLSKDDILYDRLEILPTIELDYKEYNDLLGGNIIDYIKFGGTFAPDEFYTQQKVNKYIETSITDNLVNTLNKLDNTDGYASLMALIRNPDEENPENKNKIYTVMEKVIGNENEELTLNVLKGLLHIGDLGRTLNTSIFRNDSAYDNINRQNIYNKLREKLKANSLILQEDIGPLAHKQILAFLEKIEVIKKYKKYLNEVPVDTYLFNLPGLRYNQVCKLVESVLEDSSVRDLVEDKQTNLKNQIEMNTQGLLLEHYVLNRCLNVAENSDIVVTQVNSHNKEWDMVIYKKLQDQMDIYEIKRNENIYPQSQFTHLVDDNFRQYYEDILHKKVRNRYLLYRGTVNQEKEYQGKTIICKNIENYLKNLNQNNIF